MSKALPHLLEALKEMKKADGHIVSVKTQALAAYIRRTFRTPECRDKVAAVMAATIKVDAPSVGKRFVPHVSGEVKAPKTKVGGEKTAATDSNKTKVSATKKIYVEHGEDADTVSVVLVVKNEGDTIKAMNIIVELPEAVLTVESVDESGVVGEDGIEFAGLGLEAGATGAVKYTVTRDRSDEPYDNWFDVKVGDEILELEVDVEYSEGHSKNKDKELTPFDKTVIATYQMNIEALKGFLGGIRKSKQFAEDNKLGIHSDLTGDAYMEELLTAIKKHASTLVSGEV